MPKSEPTIHEDQPKTAPAPTSQQPTPEAQQPVLNPQQPDSEVQQSSPNPQQPTTGPQQPASTSRIRRVGSINIKTTPVNVATAIPQPNEAAPLDDAKLHECWNAMLVAMKGEFPKLAELLKDKELRIDGEDVFTIIVSNSFVESEIKPHLIRMLTYLRAKSGRPNLNCKTEVVYEEKETKAYAPRDKYDVMQQSNPALESFRVLFPEVDY